MRGFACEHECNVTVVVWASLNLNAPTRDAGGVGLAVDARRRAFDRCTATRSASEPDEPRLRTTKVEGALATTCAPRVAAEQSDAALSRARAFWPNANSVPS